MLLMFYPTTGTKIRLDYFVNGEPTMIEPVAEQLTYPHRASYNVTERMMHAELNQYPACRQSLLYAYTIAAATL